MKDEAPGEVRQDRPGKSPIYKFHGRELEIRFEIIKILMARTAAAVPESLQEKVDTIFNVMAFGHLPSPPERTPQ